MASWKNPRIRIQNFCKISLKEELTFQIELDGSNNVFQDLSVETSAFVFTISEKATGNKFERMKVGSCHNDEEQAIIVANNGTLIVRTAYLNKTPVCMSCQFCNWWCFLNSNE